MKTDSTSLVIQYVLDTEGEDFKENPGIGHVYYHAMVSHYGEDEAMKILFQDSVEQDVRENFTMDEINSMSFDVFFAMVDASHGYEEEWEADKYKPLYEETFNKMRGAQL
jgi:hypothetical protein